MALTREQLQALEERRGGRVTPAPVATPSGPLMEIPAEDAAAFGVSTTPVATRPLPMPTFPGGPLEPVKPPEPPTKPDVPDDDGKKVVDPNAWAPAKDARNTIKAVLATYGLGGLADKLYNLYATGEINIDNPDALIFAIRNEDEYKTRFAANAARAKKGLAELDPGSYIELENSYRRLLQSNGLPTGFYDQTDDFKALLEGDVSPSELQDRVQNGFRAVQDADPEVKRQMQELYGVNDAGLAAYFLDPTKAAPILTRQAEAAKIAARAKQQANLQLGFATAEEIAARGITAQEAEAGFTALGLQQGLFTEMAGEEALTQQEKVGAALGYDVAAQTKLAQRKGQRKAPFAGGGGFTKTTGTTSGTIETGLGEAQ